MSAKITVIGENRRIKRTLALTLVMKQVFDWHVYMSSIKRRPTSEQKAARPKLERAKCYATLEHHLEPKLERFGQMDTEWLLYLNGYDLISE